MREFDLVQVGTREVDAVLVHVVGNNSTYEARAFVILPGDDIDLGFLTVDSARALDVSDALDIAEVEMARWGLQRLIVSSTVWWWNMTWGRPTRSSLELFQKRLRKN